MEYRFGEFRLDTDLGRLTGPGGDIVLRRQAWRLLVELLEQAPALVERDQLLDRVWGRQALSPNALPQTISELRQALGDKARQPRYIETSHGRGYRLLCPVSKPAPADVGHDDQPEANQSVSPKLAPWPMLGTVAATLVLALIVLAWSGHGDRSDPASLPPMADSLRQQAEVALARRDPESAAAHLRALTLLVPEEGQLKLQLAEAELDALQGQQARRTVALLAADPAMREQPRLMMLQARLAEIDGDFEQLARQAEAARIQAHSLGQLEEISRALRLQARALKRQGQLEAAAELIAQALADDSLRLDPAQQFDLQLEKAVLRREQGHLSQARELIEEILSSSHDRHQRHRIIIEQALMLAADGEPGAAWQSLTGLTEFVDEAVSAEWQLAYFNAVGTIGLEVGEIETALAAFERGFALARASGQAYQTAGLQINAGALLARRDRFEEAERLWQAALETFERIGDRRGQAVALGNLAAAASAQGHNTRAVTLNQQALEQFRELGLDGPLARTAFNLALVASREGQLDQAEALLAEAQAAYARAGHVEMVLHVGAFRADHRVLAGDLMLAEALLAELESQIEKGSPLRQAAVLASRGRIEQWRGDLAAARIAFEQASALRQQSGQSGWVATSSLELLQLGLLEDMDPWRKTSIAVARAGRPLGPSCLPPRPCSIRVTWPRHGMSWPGFVPGRSNLPMPAWRWTWPGSRPGPRETKSVCLVSRRWPGGPWIRATSASWSRLKPV
jgi:DNA-binding winged helix-turn-helix (wHTH) protein